MAQITADRVKETTTTTGTGTITLAGAASNFRTFSSVMATGDTCYYAIVSQSGSFWEVGLGTLASSTTLARTTVISSSNSNTAVNLSGTSDVFMTAAASQFKGLLALQAVQTSAFNATAGSLYPVNTTSAAITATLPASPSAGDTITFQDYAGTFSTNNLTLNLNGKNMMGVSTNFIVTQNWRSITIIYVDATKGWLALNTSVAQPSNIPTTSYLTVAGGGGAGGTTGTNSYSGGGGGGGVVTGTASLTVGVTYSVTVGAGGAGASGLNSGSQGSNSQFAATTAAVGGGGGAGFQYANNSLAGGSGGGGANAQITGGAATSGQGYAGGNGVAYTGSTNVSGGGGGGGGAVGTNASVGTAGNGGIGKSSSITGTAVYYAGGGGGGGYTAAGTGGSGGGGNGATNANGSNGTFGTGGGGGGTASNSLYLGGNGGTGCVILSVPTAVYSANYTGSPAITVSGSNTILTWTQNGSYTA